ncbi:MAG TPA: DUF2892 domain-containing protein [Chryseolinea sp.]|nr:DUF2892 domain-containing protein [Chryseolinea sp.]HPM32785.1 DUF2892 domain-containing protein [Chryseolinea sp.]
MKERIIRAVAGTFVLISITLAYFIHIYWLGLAAFVGLNLLQSSFTRFCPLDTILDKVGIQNGKSC